MEDTQAVLKEEGQTETVTYTAYKRRWAMMVTVMLLNISNTGMGFNVAPVAYKAADYFEVTQYDITWFSQVYLILPVALSFVSTYIFNKFDMKAGVHIGSALNCVGALTRAVATSGLIADLWTQYVVSLIGQVVAPIVVTKKQQIPTLNYIYGGLALLAEIATLICVTRSRPPTPPSRSAEQGTTARAPYLQQLKQTFTSPPFLGLLIMTGVLTGFYLCLTTLSQQMLCSKGYSDLFSGVVVAIFSIAGFVGSIAIAVVENRTSALADITKFANAFGVIFGIMLMEVYLVPGQHALLIISSILFGFFGCGVYPISLEIGVEITYPVEETISTTLIFVTGQILGVLMNYTANVLSSDLPPELQDIEVCTKNITSDLQARDYSGVVMGLMGVLTFIVILFTVFFRTPYKRREVEQTTDMSDTAEPTTSTCGR
ncbi:solute carrier family 49 member A3-like isoform X2 [Portunus trituberculatus]|uniref:solute carrier family 49 member A3-like isoform X2 n=1 Tax=Portunus trituberculatus TaxID=210409 RepID=UPI001E1CF98C|nr:solute carrier family 49 member A3-like isoform X2 [Portunus trituberculatus]